MAITLRSSSEISYPILSTGVFTATLSVRETGPVDAAKPRLLDRVREAIRTRHYSRRTEKAYVHWIKRYIFFHGKRHPAEMGAAEVTAFLTFLAVEGKVASPREVRAVFQGLDGVPRLMAILLLRRRPAPAGVLSHAREGRRLRDEPDHHPRWQRAQGSTDDAAGHGQGGTGTAPAGSSYPARSCASTRTPAGTGDGSGSSRPRASTWTASQASGAATTSTNPCFSER
jgi:hypothetical protein